MTDMNVGKDRSAQIVHHLMHIDEDAPVIFSVKGNGLHMRVNLAPLLRPVSADFLRPTDKTALERFRPNHLGAHERKSGVDVARVEGRVSRTKHFDLGCIWIWHKERDEI